MWKTKLCINTFAKEFSDGMSVEEQLRLFKQTGFEGFFFSWEKGTDLQAVSTVRNGSL